MRKSEGQKIPEKEIANLSFIILCQCISKKCALIKDGRSDDKRTTGRKATSQAADQGYVQICKRSRLLRFSQSSLPRIPSDLRERKTIKPLATIHFAKQATKKRIGRFGIVSDGFEPQNQPVFVPGTKTKLRTRGFEIVRGFVPGFVPNAYAKTRGGIRRQGGRSRRPSWS